MRDFRNKMREKMALLRMDEGFAARYVNEGFSGGEKKRLEMLQMAVLEPEMAILDETDSGLDIDALRIVAEGVNAMLNPDLGVLLITHYQRLLNYITPDYVHVLAQGKIITSRRQGPRAAARGRGLRPGPARERLRDRPARRGAARPEGAGRRRARSRGERPLGGHRPMTITSRADDRELRRPRAAGGFPDPRRAGQRPPAGLSRLGVDEPEAVGRHRRRRRLLPRVQRQRPSRDLHDRREGDGGVRGGPASRSRGSSTPPTATRSSSPATRPRRSTSSPTRGAGGTSTAATRSS